jgi:hypothetical protein
MNGLGAIACGAGLNDSLNPFIFMTCAFFIAQGFWFYKGPLRISWFRWAFVLIYVSGFLEFNFGPGQLLIFKKEFLFAARVILFCLSIGTFILGGLFLKDWLLMQRGLPVKDPVQDRSGAWVNNALTASLATGASGILLSALAATGPMNRYIMLLGNESLLRGQWLSVIPLLLGYVICSMWPLWFVWAVLSVKSLRPSMLKIICASVFFTASSCIILTFK